jgi:hypothetical protein
MRGLRSSWMGPKTSLSCGLSLDVQVRATRAHTLGSYGSGVLGEGQDGELLHVCVVLQWLTVVRTGCYAVRNRSWVVSTAVVDAERSGDGVGQMTAISISVRLSSRSGSIRIDTTTRLYCYLTRTYTGRYETAKLNPSRITDHPPHCGNINSSL